MYENLHPSPNHSPRTINDGTIVSYDWSFGDNTWLVVSSPNAQFQGEGTINGEGLYTFRVLAKDGDEAGGQPDEFTIKIWQGTDTEAGPIYQALHAQLAGGNIIIHTK